MTSSPPSAQTLPTPSRQQIEPAGMPPEVQSPVAGVPQPLFAGTHFPPIAAHATAPAGAASSAPSPREASGVFASIGVEPWAVVHAAAVTERRISGKARSTRHRHQRRKPHELPTRAKAGWNHGAP